MTKVIGPGGVIKSYDRAKFFTVEEHLLSGLDDLHTLLVQLAPQPSCVVIRGRLMPGLDATAVHQRNGKTFSDVAHHVAMFDVDNVPAPPGMSPTSPDAVEWLVRNHFPTEFHDASYVYQFSSSAGFSDKIKVHLWFWLDRATKSAELKAWAKSFPQFDAAVFQTVQCHYVAAPIAQGVADPLPTGRTALVRKASDTVSLNLTFTPPPAGMATVPVLTAPVVDQAGLISEGREAWLLHWNIGWIRGELAAGRKPALITFIKSAVGAFYQDCSNADGSWPISRVTDKAASTLRRAEAGEIAGLPALGLQPHWHLSPEPISDIRDALTSKVADFFAGRIEADVLALAYPPATGKTTTVVAAIKDAVASGQRGTWFSHSIAQAEEVAGMLGPICCVIRGREAPSGSGTMCLRPDMARAVAVAGLSVEKSLCAGCYLAAACAYKVQFIGLPPVAILNHAHLRLKPHSDFGTDFAVIDEAFASACMETGEMLWSDFAKVFPPAFDYRLLQAIRHPDPLAAIRGIEDGGELLANAARAVWRGVPSPTFHTSDTPADIKPGRKNVALISRILRTLLIEFHAAPQRATSHVVRIIGDQLRYSLLADLRALSGTSKVLVIDAQADAIILRNLFPGRSLEFDRRDAVSNMDVIQMTGSTMSLARLEGEGGILDRISTFAAWWGKGTALFVQKSVRHRLTLEPKGKTLPVACHWQGLDVGHFGHLKGTNHFEGHHTAIVVGRSQMPPSAVESMSGMFLRDPEPLNFAGEYVREDRGYCHPSGRGASVHVHPDPRFQLVLEQRRCWELVQAIHRLRGFNPKVRKTVFLLTDLVLPIGISRLVPEFELIAEWRTLAMENGGLILDSPTWLASTYPTRWATRAAAREWVGRHWQSVTILNEKIIKDRDALPSPAPSPVIPDILEPVRVWHRPVPTRRDRQASPKRALHLGNLMDLPAALDAAAGGPTEFVAHMGCWLIATNLMSPEDDAAARKAAAHLVIHEGSKMPEDAQDIHDDLINLAAENPFSFKVTTELSAADIKAARAAAKALKDHEERMALAEDYRISCEAYANAIALMDMIDDMDKEKMSAALDLPFTDDERKKVNDWISSNP